MERSEGSELSPHIPVTGILCPQLTVMGWSGRAAQAHLAGQQILLWMGNFSSGGLTVCCAILLGRYG